MDAYCGARELCLSVPFLLYNCTGLLLTITESNHERNGHALIIPPSYSLAGNESCLVGKQGLALLPSELESNPCPHLIR